MQSPSDHITTAHRFATTVITQPTNGARIHLKGRTTIPRGDLSETRDGGASTSFKCVQLRLIQRGPTSFSDGVKRTSIRHIVIFHLQGKGVKHLPSEGWKSRSAFFSLVPEGNTRERSQSAPPPLLPKGTVNVVSSILSRNAPGIRG